MRGEKTCEIRRNDRDFKVGDGLLLRRTKYTGNQMHMRPEQCPLEYTGEECRRIVSHVLTGYGLEDNCALSFATPANMAVGAVGGVGADWGLDISTGTPILVHKNCSVIESEQARYVLRLIAADQTPAPEQATTGSGQGVTDAERLDWLDSQSASDGFDGMPRVNAWGIHGPFSNIRQAIDAAILSTASPAGEVKT